MRWFISDTHFGHANIIRLANRPFLSVDEMDSCLIDRWNEKVKEGDEVFFLGDFGFGRTVRLREICEKLNGFKVCIRGNHDRSPTAMKRMGFDVVLEAAMIKIDGKKIVLQHEPSIDTPYGCLILHGHVHNIGASYFLDGQMCVCVELWDYYPVSENVIFKHVRKHVSAEEKKMLLL